MNRILIIEFECKITWLHYQEFANCTDQAFNGGNMTLHKKLLFCHIEPWFLVETLLIIGEMTLKSIFL